MTTLYRPVLIESAEQAEALPDGTLVIDMTPDDPYAWRKSGTFFIDHTGGTCEATPTEIAGFRPTALVPIEAEEEWTAMGEDHGDPWIAHVGHDGIDGTREEAEAYTRRFGGFLAHRNRTPWEEA